MKDGGGHGYRFDAWIDKTRIMSTAVPTRLFYNQTYIHFQDCTKLQSKQNKVRYNQQGSLFPIVSLSMGCVSITFLNILTLLTYSRQAAITCED